MEDYPRTLADFEERFRSEEACRDYLFRVRWPEGFRCPRCGESRGWRLRSALWQCARCAYQASLDCGDDFPGHAHSSEVVIPRAVVDDQPEEWRQRPRSEARVGARQLPNRVVLAAQTKAGDGASGPGTTVGNCRG